MGLFVVVKLGEAYGWPIRFELLECGIRFSVQQEEEDGVFTGLLVVEDLDMLLGRSLWLRTNLGEIDSSL